MLSTSLRRDKLQSIGWTQHGFWWFWMGVSKCGLVSIMIALILQLSDIAQTSLSYMKPGLWCYPHRFGTTTVCLLLSYAIATVLQIYHSHNMMYEMRRRTPKPTLLLIRGIFNPYRNGMRGTDLWWHFKLYISGQTDCSTAKYYNSEQVS